MKVPSFNKRRVIIMVVALAILISAVSLLHKPTFTETNPLVTSAANPDESKDNAKNYKWQGATDEPKTLRIPSLNVDAFIQKLGVDQNNQIATPNNINLAGWYNASAKPSQNGLSIIVGHVSGVRSDGIFKNLDKLNTGDVFEVIKGNGSTVTYKVINKKQVPEADAVAYLFSQEPDVPSQLNLITCTGKFDIKLNKYPDRLIVQGKLQ